MQTADGLGERRLFQFAWWGARCYPMYSNTVLMVCIEESLEAAVISNKMSSISLMQTIAMRMLPFCFSWSLFHFFWWIYDKMSWLVCFCLQHPVSKNQNLMPAHRTCQRHRQVLHSIDDERLDLHTLILSHLLCQRLLKLPCQVSTLVPAPHLSPCTFLPWFSTKRFSPSLSLTVTLSSQESNPTATTFAPNLYLVPQPPWGPRMWGWHIWTSHGDWTLDGRLSFVSILHGSRVIVMLAS
jgi:hypothetical protein